MPEPTAAQTISLIGILVELGACLLFTTLVLGLRRETTPRPYSIHWSWAWLARSVALAAMVEFLARLKISHWQKPFDLRVLVQLVERFRVGSES